MSNPIKCLYWFISSTHLNKKKNVLDRITKNCEGISIYWKIFRYNFHSFIVSRFLCFSWMYFVLFFRLIIVRKEQMRALLNAVSAAFLLVIVVVVFVKLWKRERNRLKHLSGLKFIVQSFSRFYLFTTSFFLSFRIYSIHLSYHTHRLNLVE